MNGEVHPIIWEKGLLDGVGMFDLELARLSQDGIIKAALNGAYFHTLFTFPVLTVLACCVVPANAHYMNILVQDVPSGDDYYLLFLNSTSGVMFTSSSKFAIHFAFHAIMAMANHVFHSGRDICGLVQRNLVSRTSH